MAYVFLIDQGSYVNKEWIICQVRAGNRLQSEIDPTPGLGYNKDRMNSLKVGDKVIYPNQGLGIIEAIKDGAYNDERFKIFHVRIVTNNTLVQIPSSAAEEMGIRRPISESSIKKIFHFMRKGPVDITMNWKGRYKEHLNLMKSGTLLDMALVLKSLFYLSLIKPLSFREKKMMERAKELIVTEISEASCESCSRIEHRLLDTLSRCFKDTKPRLDV
jgi:CarD family transcriptional regulator